MGLNPESPHVCSERAQVCFAPGHKLHKVEVEDDMAKITDAAAFHERLLKHLPKS